VGISDEGCRALRSIRQDNARGCEMPLQCLRDRRTYLIDAASGGRQVPPLVEAGAAMRSVACVPLCAGETPHGSLVLVALAPRALSEHDLQQLAGPLDEVVRMIETARRPRAGAPAPAPEPSGLLAEPGLGGEVAAGPAERGSALGGEIGVLRETVATLRGEVQTLAAERDRLRGALAQLQAEPDPVVAEDAPATAAAEPTPIESPPAPAAPPRPAAQPPSALRPRAVGARRLVVVLDVDSVWEGAVIDGTEVRVVEP